MGFSKGRQKLSLDFDCVLRPSNENSPFSQIPRMLDCRLRHQQSTHRRSVDGARQFRTQISYFDRCGGCRGQRDRRFQLTEANWGECAYSSRIGVPSDRANLEVSTCRHSCQPLGRVASGGRSTLNSFPLPFRASAWRMKALVTPYATPFSSTIVGINTRQTR